MSQKKANPFKRGKTWTYIITYIDEETGKNKRKWVGGFKTKEDATIALNEATSQLAARNGKAPPTDTVGEYITKWFNEVHKPFLKPTTARGYEVNIRLHIIPDIGHIPLTKLNRNDVMAFYNKLIGKGLSPASVKYVHNTLTKGLKEAVLSDLILKNPCNGVKMPKVKKYKSEILNEEQLAKLLQGAAESDVYLEILLAATLGLRRGEALGVRFKDFNYTEGTVHIRQQITIIDAGNAKEHRQAEWGISTLKTEESDRVLYVAPTVLRVVKEQEKQVKCDRLRLGKDYHNYDLVCCKENGEWKNPQTVLSAYHRVLENARLPSVRFHDLRHSFASIMIEKDIPLKTVSHILGHSSIIVTADVYCDVIRRHKDAADIAEKCFFPADIMLSH